MAYGEQHPREARDMDYESDDDKSFHSFRSL